MLNTYRNLIIMRTLSKIGLASLRTGFIIGDKDLIYEINKVRLPFNVNSFSQAIALQVLTEPQKLDANNKLIIEERDKLYKQMSAIKPIKTYPSDANFILFKAEGADKLHSELLNEGILIKNLNTSLKGCLRVTIGTAYEMEAFINSLRRICERGK
ncbi:histidinol-phosphate aminotransferase, partial [Candidatus Omnitrophus magneticus]